MSFRFLLPIAVVLLFLIPFLMLLMFLASMPALGAETPAVVINELLWMGSPVSAQDEWIELFNTTTQDIDLTGWKITKRSSSTETDMLVIPSGIIPAGGYFLIANYSNENENSALTVVPDLVDTAVSLVNSQLLVKLYDAGGTEVDVADEGIGMPFAGKYISGSTWASMERHRVDIAGTDASAWHTSSAAYGSTAGFFATPRAANSNSAPEIACDGPEEVTLGTEAAFNATATDADGDTLVIAWDVDGQYSVGPTFTHTFTDEGEATVRCKADDGRATIEDTLPVFVRDDAPVDPQKPPTKITPPPEPTKTPPADPETQPEQPAEPDAPPYITSSDVLITALLPNPVGADATEEFIEITNFGKKTIDVLGWSVTDGSRTYTFDASTPVKSNGVLRILHTTSSVSLNNSGDTIQLIDPFGKKVNGVEYGMAPEGEMFLRDGETTHWFWSGGEEKEEKQEEEPAEQNVPPEKTPKTSYQSTTIRELGFLDTKANVEFSGTVLALPGQIAAHMLFVGADDAVIRVYSSSDRFPDVALGDVVTVRGQLAQDQNGEKINLGRDGTVEKSAADITSSLEQTIEGIVREKNRTLVTLDTDDGVVQVRIKSGTGIALSELTPATQVAVTGFYFGTEFFPRSPDDIRIMTGDVLGAATTGLQQTQDVQDKQIGQDGTITELAEPASSQPFTLVALILVAAMLVGGAIFFVLHRRNTGRSIQ